MGAARIRPVLKQKPAPVARRCQQHIGDAFDGTIVTVTNFGVFVELDDIHIEGLIHVTALRNDYYHFNDVAHTLTGERTGDSFHLGDRVHVQVSRVDMEDHKIDLQLVSVLKQNRTSAPVPQRERKAKKGGGKGQHRKKKSKAPQEKQPAAKTGKAKKNNSRNRRSKKR